jgi:hypothetical protein
LLEFCHEVRPALLVSDENPLRDPEQWRQKVARELRIPFWTVDADASFPAACWARSTMPRAPFAHACSRLCQNFSSRCRPLAPRWPGDQRASCNRRKQRMTSSAAGRLTAPGPCLLLARRDSRRVACSALLC